MVHLFSKPCDCEKIRHRFDAYLDGELSEKEEKKLCAHLEHCEFCREALAERNKWKQVILREPLTPPDSLHDRVMHRIEQDSCQEAPSFPFRRHWGLIGSLCTFVLIVGALLLPLSRNFGGSKSEDADAIPSKPSVEAESESPEHVSGSGNDRLDSTESPLPDSSGNYESAAIFTVSGDSCTVRLFGNGLATVVSANGREQHGSYIWIDKNTLEITADEKTAVYLCEGNELIRKGGDLFD